MTDYQLSVLHEVRLAPLIPLATSLLFWWSDARGPAWRRVAACSHGACFFLAFLYALLICPISKGYGLQQHNPYETPFLVLLCLGLASSVASLVLFRGRKALHLLHLLAIPAAAWTAFIGAMAITHDWI